METAKYLVVMLMGLAVAACDHRATAADEKIPAATAPTTSPYNNVQRTDKVVKSETEWKKQLTAEQFNILREKGTERAFTGATWNNHDKGIYTCAACELELFSSDTKFESGTGWPSFWQ